MSVQLAVILILRDNRNESGRAIAGYAFVGKTKAYRNDSPFLMRGKLLSENKANIDKNSNVLSM